MRVEYKDLMEKLAVGYELSPYETQPWLYYDAEKGITCNAEVRAGPGLSDIEAEIQFMYDEGCEPRIEEEDEPNGDDELDERFLDLHKESYEEMVRIEAQLNRKKVAKLPPGLIPGGPQQIFIMRIMPMKDGLWSPDLMMVKGENFVNKIYDWEGKGCDFFSACIQALQMEELPDVDALIEKELQDESEGGRGKRGRIGKKITEDQAGSFDGHETLSHRCEKWNRLATNSILWLCRRLMPLVK